MNESPEPAPVAAPIEVPPRSPSPATPRTGTGILLLLWLWPVAVAVAGGYYVERRAAAQLEAAMADRPRVTIVDEMALMRAAVVSGVPADNPAKMRAALERQLAEITREDTIVLPTQVVTAAPPQFFYSEQVKQAVANGAR